MKEVMDNVKGMVREAKDPKNDGDVAKVYKNELKKIHSYIESQFPDFHYAPTDGYEVGSPGDYDE